MKQDAALLLTDLVDSTLLSERLGDEAMSDVWKAHDRVSRDLLAAWAGTEINRSDGFLLRFASAADAAGYAVAYHRAIARLSPPLAARAGLHIGTVIARDNHEQDLVLGAKATELAGLAISTAARLMAIALPGQTLMTRVARDALSGQAQRLVSHGHWRLKGLEDPIEIFEVGDDVSPFETPPDVVKAYRVALRNRLWLPVREVPHSLSAERNTFVGRERDLRDLGERLARGVRLITVCGIGGTGKTRLVQHFGWRTLGDYSGGTWYCDLSQTTTLDGLCGAVAQGLNVPLGKTDPVDQIAHAIAGHGPCLVVLDNFEQVIAHVEATIGRWLDRAIDARFIVTTRSVLGLDGEDLLMLSPLAPAEAVTLFVERAKAVRQDFASTSSERRLLVRLVDLLDGLPLAIELAAARAGILQLEEMLDRMQDRFQLLRTGKGRPSRQATLLATFHWSWDLLEPVERDALAQLSVFEGGFTLRALERVVDPVGFGDMTVVDLLQSLVEKSWVRHTEPDRFALLNSVRDYGTKRLDEANRAAAERRHWTFYRSLSDDDVAADRCVEIDNLVAATRRATVAGDTDAAVDCLDRTWSALRLRGPARACIELVASLTLVPGLTGVPSARVQHIAGRAFQHYGQTEKAKRCFELGLVSAREAQADAQEAWLLCALGELATSSSDFDEASRLLDAARQIAKPFGDPALRSVAMNAVGGLSQCLGRPTEAADAFREALLFANAANDKRRAAGILGNLGGASHALKRYPEARDYYERTLRAARTLGDRRLEGNTSCNFGLLCFEQGDLDEARQLLDDALVNAKELGYLRLEATVSWNLGLIAEALGAAGDALPLYRRAYELAGHHHDRRAQGELCGLLGAVICRLHRDAARAEPYFVLGEKLLSLYEDRERLEALHDRRRSALEQCRPVE